MSLWTENLAVLERRFPGVARRVASQNRAGKIWLKSAESEVISRHWLENLSWNDGMFLVVSGFGDGRHVRALLERLPKEAWVFVAEPEMPGLKNAFQNFDLRAVLEDSRLMIGAGDIDEEFFESLRNLDVLRVKDVETMIFAPEYNRAESYFVRAFTEVARQIDFRRKLFGTAVVDAALWQYNTFANLATVATAPDVSVLQNVCKGMAMVVVSAGPSLDESIEFIREVSGIAVIVAVNSSYRAVRRAGIVPHFVIAADPRQFTARGFGGVPIDGTWLVTTPIVDPAVPGMFGGAVFSWSGSNTLVTELRRRCGLPPGTTLVEQGTVSACAVDLAVVLGCDRVCLVGQDMAVREDGRSHVRDSFYTDLSANHVDVSKCRRLPGNVVEEVPVEEKLFVYLKTFEQLVTQRPQLSFLNTAKYGARIAGVAYANLNEAKQWIGGGSSANLEGVIAERWRHSNGKGLNRDGIAAVLKTTETFAENALRMALGLAAKIESLPDRFSAESYRNAPEVREVLRQADELERMLKSQAQEFRILEAGRTRLELFRCGESGVGAEAMSAHWKQVLMAREFAWAIAEGAWFLTSCLGRFGAGSFNGGI